MSLSDALERDKDRFMRFLVARTRDPSLAEDLFQEARIKLMGQGAGEVASPVSYIFQMLSNLVEDYRRSETARAARSRAWGDRGEGLEPGRADHITPETSALDSDMLMRVSEALSDLPEATRAILIAYRVEGKAQKAIAEDHGISLSAVEKHLQRGYRAVIAIREKLGAGLD